MYKLMLLLVIFGIISQCWVEACIKRGNSCDADKGRIANCCYPYYCYRDTSSCISPD